MMACIIFSVEKNLRHFIIFSPYTCNAYFSSVFFLLFILDKVSGLSATGEAKLRWQKDQTQYKQAKQQERYGMERYGIFVAHI